MFRKRTLFMISMLAILFLFPLTSYAAGFIEVPVDINITKTGDQDLPNGWYFEFKLTEADGSDIVSGTTLDDNRIYWTGPATTLTRNLSIDIPTINDWDNPSPGVRAKTYMITPVNRQAIGWEFDDSKFYVDIIHDPDQYPLTQFGFTLRDKDSNPIVPNARAPFIEFNHRYNQNMQYIVPFSVQVEVRQGGSIAPPAETFSLELQNFDRPNQPNKDIVELVDNAIATNGVGITVKDLKIKVDINDIINPANNWGTAAPNSYRARFKLKMKNDNREYWTYDTTDRYIEISYDHGTKDMYIELPIEADNDAYHSPAEFVNIYTRNTSPGGGGPSGANPTPSTTSSATPIKEFIKDHIAYIKGYPDGTIRPMGNITRAETATMIYRLLTEQRRAEIRTTANSFSDIRAGAWFSGYVSSMAKGKYILGYPNGTFGPDKTITRAEFVTMLVRFIEPAKGEKTFSDVTSNHWAYQNIGTATAAGWIEGYPDGRFEPNKNITRADAVSILNRILNRGVNEKSNLLNFKNWNDNKAISWYYYEIIEAGNSHEYTGVRPSENWTKILDKTLE